MRRYRKTALGSKALYAINSINTKNQTGVRMSAQTGPRYDSIRPYIEHPLCAAAVTKSLQVTRMKLPIKKWMVSNTEASLMMGAGMKAVFAGSLYFRLTPCQFCQMITPA